MSSSLDDEFQPPEWATKDEVTKAARHYINYWKVEAQHRNGQWLDELEKKAKAMGEAALLRSQLDEARYEAEKWQRAEHAVGAKLNEVCLEAIRLKAEVERLTPADEALKAYDEGEINEFIYWHLEWTSRNAAKQGGQP